MIRVLVDSSADFRKEELEAKQIMMVPLSVNVGEDSYQDEVELERDRLYDLLINGKKTVKTSQPSPQKFAEAFEQVKENGDELICIIVSSAISGTYQSACLAKDMVEYDKIHIIDSLSATGGTQILADHALDMIAKGCSAEQIVEALEELKGRIGIIAAVDTLKYLYLGGRVSRTTALIGDAVNVKPSITLTRAGEVGVVGKYLGASRALRDFVKQMKNAKIDTDYPVHVLYSYGYDNVKKLETSLNENGIKTDRMIQLGAALGVHVGPGAFGVIYIEKK